MLTFFINWFAFIAGKCNRGDACIVITVDLFFIHIAFKWRQLVCCWDRSVDIKIHRYFINETICPGLNRVGTFVYSKKSTFRFFYSFHSHGCPKNLRTWTLGTISYGLKLRVPVVTLLKRWSKKKLLLKKIDFFE